MVVIIKATPAEEFALALQAKGVTGPAYGKAIMSFQGACDACGGFPNQGGSHAAFCPRQ